MTKVIGIDLGTANSCVAVMENGVVQVIPDPEGNRTTPSVFTVTNDQQVYVGQRALRQAEVNRLNTIFAVKRLIGRKFQSTEVQEFASKVPYTIVAAPNGDAWFEMNGELMSPEQGSAIILGRMKEIAEAYFKEPISHAVITVPAHFNDSQRQATKDAGKIAGLHVLSIINEPTAAALAYGLDIAIERDYAGGEGKKKNDRVIAVFDLGSGTFDITILALRDGVFDVLATGGDTYLGGEDFDLAIVNHLLAEFRRKEGIDLSKDRPVLQRLKEAAKIAKQELSNAFSYEVHIPYICTGGGTGVPKDLRVTIERKTFEAIVSPLLQRLDGPCIQALEDAGLKRGDIDDVILVGGMTRMPAVKYRAQKIFGKPPNDSINPDEAVATGAAIQAALLQGVLKGLQLADVTSLSLGLEVQGGKMVPLLPRNSKIPASVSEIFTTSAPNQTSVSIHLLQGEHPFVPENKSLGRFELTGIPKGPRGSARIEVTLEVDRDGIVHLSAKDLTTGQRREIEIINSSGLSESEINEMVHQTRREAASRARREQQLRQQQASDPASAPQSNQPKSEGPAAEIERLQGELRTLVFQTQFKLDIEGKRLRGGKRSHLEEIVKSARETLNTVTEPHLLRDAITAMQGAAAELEHHLEAA